MSRVRGIAAIALALVGAVAAPATPARAESALWTLTASPLAVTTGSTTTFTLRATNDDPLAALLSSSEIGCVQVDVPANFTVATATVTGSNAGGSWSASLNGNRVRVRAGSGGDRLQTLGWVSFTVRATAMSTGSLTWASRAFRDQGCTGAGALLGVPPIVVVSGPAVTPTPVPTPVPTPTPRPPTPAPTPTPILPLPSLPLPSVLPAILGTPRPTPTPASTPDPQPTSSDVPTPEPARTPPASPSGPSGGTLGPPAGGRGSPAPSGSAPSSAAPSDDGSLAIPGTPAGPGAFAPRVVVDESSFAFGGGAIGPFTGIEIWIVPGAAIAGPGILILVWIALQTAGTFAWLPAVRRLRGREERREGSGLA